MIKNFFLLIREILIFFHNNLQKKIICIKKLFLVKKDMHD